MDYFLDRVCKRLNFDTVNKWMSRNHPIIFCGFFSCMKACDHQANIGTLEALAYVALIMANKVLLKQGLPVINALLHIDYCVKLTVTHKQRLLKRLLCLNTPYLATPATWCHLDLCSDWGGSTLCTSSRPNSHHKPLWEKCIERHNHCVLNYYVLLWIECNSSMFKSNSFCTRISANSKDDLMRADTNKNQKHN